MVGASGEHSNVFSTKKEKDCFKKKHTSPFHHRYSSWTYSFLDSWDWEMADSSLLADQTGVVAEEFASAWETSRQTAPASKQQKVYWRPFSPFLSQRNNQVPLHFGHVHTTARIQNESVMIMGWMCDERSHSGPIQIESGIILDWKSQDRSESQSGMNPGLF